MGRLCKFLKDKEFSRPHIQRMLRTLEDTLEMDASFNDDSDDSASDALDTVERAYAHFLSEKLEKSFESRGLKRSQKLYRCAIELHGKRCKQQTGKKCPDHKPPTADHVSLWNKNGKTCLYVWHPYGMSSYDHKKLMEYCDRMGFEFDISASSFYNPGSTLCVCMWKKDANPLSR